MYRETNSLTSVGFRHVLEDGLAILAGQQLNQDRKAFVLQDLAQVLTEAKQCSDVARGQGWFLANANQEAFELFSILERSLAREGKQWHALLDAAASVLQALAGGAAGLSDAQRQEATQFLKTILSCVTNLPKAPGLKDVEFGARLRQANT